MCNYTPKAPTGALFLEDTHRRIQRRDLALAVRPPGLTRWALGAEPLSWRPLHEALPRNYGGQYRMPPGGVVEVKASGAVEALRGSAGGGADGQVFVFCGGGWRSPSGWPSRRSADGTAAGDRHRSAGRRCRLTMRRSAATPWRGRATGCAPMPSPWPRRPSVPPTTAIVPTADDR
jgi:hypothetical protein